MRPLPRQHCPRTAAYSMVARSVSYPDDNLNTRESAAGNVSVSCLEVWRHVQSSNPAGCPKAEVNTGPSETAETAAHLNR